MLDQRIRKPRLRSHAQAPALPAARLGRLEGVTEDGSALVSCPGWFDAPVAALVGAAAPRPTLADAVGLSVVLLPLEHESASAVIVGWLDGAPAAVNPNDLRVDGRRVVVAAGHELELRCGEASLTLTADGRVLIRGRGVLTQAREVNRIRGGQVQIN